MRYPLKLAESNGCACNHAPQCISGYLAYLDGSTVLIGLYMIYMIPAYDGSNPSSCFVSSCSNTTPLTGWQNLTPVEVVLTALSSLIRVPSETPPPYNARDDDGVSYKSNATLNFPDDPSPTLSNFDVSSILITSNIFLRLWNTAPPHIG